MNSHYVSDITMAGYPRTRLRRECSQVKRWNQTAGHGHDVWLSTIAAFHWPIMKISPLNIEDKFNDTSKGITIEWLNEMLSNSLCFSPKIIAK